MGVDTNTDGEGIEEMNSLMLNASIEPCAHCKTVWRGRDPHSEDVDLDWKFFAEKDVFVHGDCARVYVSRRVEECRRPLPASQEASIPKEMR